MITYMDRSYCSTNGNNCSNRACDKHLQTTDEQYTLANNKYDLPICITDFSGECTEYLTVKHSD